MARPSIRLADSVSQYTINITYIIYVLYSIPTFSPCVLERRTCAQAEIYLMQRRKIILAKLETYNKAPLAGTCVVYMFVYARSHIHFICTALNYILVQWHSVIKISIRRNFAEEIRFYIRVLKRK